MAASRSFDFSSAMWHLGEGFGKLSLPPGDFAGGAVYHFVHRLALAIAGGRREGTIPRGEEKAKTISPSIRLLVLIGLTSPGVPHRSSLKTTVEKNRPRGRRSSHTHRIKGLQPHHKWLE